MCEELWQPWSTMILRHLVVVEPRRRDCVVQKIVFARSPPANHISYGDLMSWAVVRYFLYAARIDARWYLSELCLQCDRICKMCASSLKCAIQVASVYTIRVARLPSQRHVSCGGIMNWATFSNGRSGKRVPPR